MRTRLKFPITKRFALTTAIVVSQLLSAAVARATEPYTPPEEFVMPGMYL